MKWGEFPFHANFKNTNLITLKSNLAMFYAYIHL